jgi:hypothetical protein
MTRGGSGSSPARTGAPASPPPVTYGAVVQWLINELHYTDLIALSGMFRRWAIHEADLEPELRTEFIMHSADFERIAEWVGPHWRAADPSDEPSMLVSMADFERRQHQNVTKLTIARRVVR